MITPNNLRNHSNRYEKRRSSMLGGKPVVQCDLDSGEVLRVCDSLSDAAGFVSHERLATWKNARVHIGEAIKRGDGIGIIYGYAWKYKGIGDPTPISIEKLATAKSKVRGASCKK